MKRIFVITSVFVGVVFLLFSCGGEQKSGDRGKRSVVVDARKVKRKTVKDTVSVVGELQAEDRVDIRPEISGIVEKIHFKEGELRETAGALLFELDDTLLRAEENNSEARLKTAKADLEKAKDDFERKKMMHEDGATTDAAYTKAKINLHRAKAEVENAKASLESARERLSKTRIRAPFSGRMGDTLVSPGSYVRPGDPLVEIVKIDPVEVSCEIPQKYSQKLREGLEVELEVEGFPEKTFTGKVFFVSPSASGESRTIKTKARIENPEGKLKPGMFCRVKLVVEKRENAVVVPESSLVPRNEKVFVYTVKDGKAEKNEVKLGQRNPGEVEILKGLKGDETVVTAGLQMITDGVPVEIRKK